MRVELVAGRYLLCGHILHWSQIQPGEVWAAASGSGHEVTIQVVNRQWVTYSWIENRQLKTHSKDPFAFQCRYCLVLNIPIAKEEA